MERGIFVPAITDQFPPDFTIKHPSGFDRSVDQTGPLVKHPSTTNGIVPYLTVAHIPVTRQPDRHAVGLQPGVGTVFMQPVKIGRIGIENSVPLGIFTITDPVHYQ